MNERILLKKEFFFINAKSISMHGLVAQGAICTHGMALLALAALEEVEVVCNSSFTCLGVPQQSHAPNFAAVFAWGL